MKRYKNLTAGLTAFIFLFTSLNSAYSATSLLNKSCKKVGSKTISLGKNLTCVSVSGIKIWKLTPKSSQKQLAKALPSIVPSFSIKHENDKVYATMIVNGQDLKVAEVENAEAIIYAKADGNYYKIGTSNWKVLAGTYSAGDQTINFSWPLLGGYKGKELAVEIKFQNSLGFGDKALKAIIIPAVEPTPTPTPASTPTSSSSSTVNQSQAELKAQSYLRNMSFSRSGLIKQLEFEGFSNADAIYGVDKQNADWSAQAFLKAQSYLRSTSFSRSGLIKQLEFEGFSNSESIFGVDKLKADWNTQAALKAQSYLRASSFSRTGLIKQLEFEGFTSEQAISGVNAAGL